MFVLFSLWRSVNPFALFLSESGAPYCFSGTSYDFHLSRFGSVTELFCLL